MFRRLIFITAICACTWLTGYPQSVLGPNSALKSHETLDIMKIEMTERNTTFYLKVENRITGGTFCADKNIFIDYPDGTRQHLLSSNGIPVCPDVYRFRNIGEQMDFTLVFPPVVKGVKSINLIEECNDNCFSFYGVIIDPDLNNKLNDAFELAENDEPAKALVSFTKIEGEDPETYRGAEGLLYLNLVKLSVVTGNKVRAAEWYRKLESSDLKDKSLYLRNLNAGGIKF